MREFPVRCGLLLAGVIAVLWLAFTLPSIWSAAAEANAASQILSGQRFRPETLSEFLRRLSALPATSMPRSTIIRAEALIRVSSTESVDRQLGTDKIDEQIAAAAESVRLSLVLNPNDSFLWFLRYSLETRRLGYDSRNLRYLNYSYELGPYEGWICLRRHRLALSIFDLLSEAVQERIVSEFALITDADLVDDATQALTSTGWPHRQRLLAGLQQVDLLSRESLSRRLARDGFKVNIPGVKKEDRPW